VQYSKPPLSYEEQADQLLGRGLVAERDVLISRLECVNYYRLSGYWHPFRRADDSFLPGTLLDSVWRRYTFDRRLRLLALDAIERVEISVRTDLCYQLAHAQGPFGYLDPMNLPGMGPTKHSEFIAQLEKEYARSQEPYVRHFRTKYGSDHSLPPYWMIVELMTFGAMLTLFRGIETPLKQLIARRYGVSDTVLESWLVSVNGLRNICAHHGRLWNRELGYKPKIPTKDKQWRDPVEVPGNRVFGILTVLKYLLNGIAPQSAWTGRFDELLADYPDIPLDQMGFPADWQLCPIWTTARGIT
jgi:abortive infection bacteriophage resistance protein